MENTSWTYLFLIVPTIWVFVEVLLSGKKIIDGKKIINGIGRLEVRTEPYLEHSSEREFAQVDKEAEEYLNDLFKKYPTARVYPDGARDEFFKAGDSYIGLLGSNHYVRDRDRPAFRMLSWNNQWTLMEFEEGPEYRVVAYLSKDLKLTVVEKNLPPVVILQN